MDTGTDGRFYDSHFDDNHDGKLDMYELSNYDDITFGENHLDDIGSSRRRVQPNNGNYGARLCGTLMMVGLIIVGLLLAIVFPPLGALCILGSYKLKEMI